MTLSILLASVLIVCMVEMAMARSVLRSGYRLLDNSNPWRQGARDAVRSWTPVGVRRGHYGVSRDAFSSQIGRSMVRDALRSSLRNDPRLTGDNEVLKLEELLAKELDHDRRRDAIHRREMEEAYKRERAYKRMMTGVEDRVLDVLLFNRNKRGAVQDIDTVIAKVVEDIWGTYDKDNSGALDKDETKQFVKDTLKEMADGDDNDEFNEEDFNKCFEEFDKDGSGTIEKDEMAIFIKKVAGL